MKKKTRLDGEANRPATLGDLREVVATILQAIDQTCVLKDEFVEFKVEFSTLKNELRTLRNEFNQFRDEVRTTFLTKDEFRQEMSIYNNNIMTMLDKVMGELKIIREEQIVSSYLLKRHTDDIDYLKRVCLTA